MRNGYVTDHQKFQITSLLNKDDVSDFKMLERGKVYVHIRLNKNIENLERNESKNGISRCKYKTTPRQIIA